MSKRSHFKSSKVPGRMQSKVLSNFPHRSMQFNKNFILQPKQLASIKDDQDSRHNEESQFCTDESLSALEYDDVVDFFSKN